MLGTAALATLALAAPQTFDVPRLLAEQIDRAHDRGAPRVLLPSRYEAPFERLYPTGGATRRGYDMQLGSVRGCGGAGACFVAAFLAERGGRPYGRRRVRLARGRTGHYLPMSCGASCAEPQIQWTERGVLYTIQASVRGRKAMVRLANSAIRNGAR